MSRTDASNGHDFLFKNMGNKMGQLISYSAQDDFVVEHALLLYFWIELSAEKG